MSKLACERNVDGNISGMVKKRQDIEDNDRENFPLKKQNW